MAAAAAAGFTRAGWEAVVLVVPCITAGAWTRGVGMMAVAAAGVCTLQAGPVGGGASVANAAAAGFAAIAAATDVDAAGFLPHGLFTTISTKLMNKSVRGRSRRPHATKSAPFWDSITVIPVHNRPKKACAEIFAVFLVMISEKINPTNRAAVTLEG